MALQPHPGTLLLYRRADCTLCDDARVLVQAALEQRVLRGESAVSVREVDVASDAELERRFGASVPVLSIDGMELGLAVSGRQIQTFLDRALGRAV